MAAIDDEILRLEFLALMLIQNDPDLEHKQRVMERFDRIRGQR